MSPLFKLWSKFLVPCDKQLLPGSRWLLGFNGIKCLEHLWLKEAEGPGGEATLQSHLQPAKACEWVFHLQTTEELGFFLIIKTKKSRWVWTALFQYTECMQATCSHLEQLTQGPGLSWILRKSMLLRSHQSSRKHLPKRHNGNQISSVCASKSRVLRFGVGWTSFSALAKPENPWPRTDKKGTQLSYSPEAFLDTPSIKQSAQKKW